jgi:hypothetical protein
MKATEIRIKKECRKLHGVEGALEKAVEILREKYLKYMEAECNKDAVIRIEIHIER